MAVYTTLNEQEISDLLSRFNLLDLESFSGASSGIENTTYFLTLTSGDQYVLTVFENLSYESLLPYIQLMTQLNQQNLPVPCPCTDQSGIALQIIARKPALLFARSRGRHIETTDAIICGEVGSILGQIHNATTGPLSHLSIANACGLNRMKDTFAFVKASLDSLDQKILEDQILLSEDLQNRQLSRGIIHGDLFRDNVLVEAGKITAVIDFYNAGQDILLLDLAIVANDWCYSQGDLDVTEKLGALLGGYQKYRSLSPVEKASWNDCLQVAASRFWLSRQRRVLQLRNGGKGLVKDPEEYKNLLLHHLDHH